MLFRSAQVSDDSIRALKSIDSLSFALPTILSLFLPLRLPLLSMTGAGSVGLPVPLPALVSSAAAATLAWDCCMTLNNLTTKTTLSAKKGWKFYCRAYLLSEQLFEVPARPLLPIPLSHQLYDLCPLSPSFLLVKLSSPSVPVFHRCVFD